MVTAFLLLALFTLLLTLRTERNNPYYAWLLLSVVSFLTAFFGYMLYVVGIAIGYSINVGYFNEHSAIWAFLCNIRISPQNVSRLLHLGVIGFAFCFFSYAQLCTQYSLIKPKRFPSFWAALPAVLSLLLTDPLILRLLFAAARHLGWRGYRFSFYDLCGILNWLIRLTVLGYLIIGYGRLLWDYRNHTIKKSKQRVMVSILCYLPITMLYMLMFYWFPTHLVSLRELHPVTQRSFTFSYHAFVHMPMQNRYYPLPVILSVLIFVLSMRFLGTKNVFQRNTFTYPNDMLRMATLQARIFSHAIKNDLLGIKLLLADLPEGNGAAEKIEHICDYNISRLNRLRQTLNVIVISRAPVDVAACMEKCIQKTLMADNITVRREYDPNSIFLVLSDENYLAEVFDAILNNAQEAIAQKGTDGEITVTIRRAYNEMCVSVADNGCGLDEEQAEQVFDMFFSTKPSSKNWGMGLAYSRRIIQLMNGEILFRSAAGKGSRVSIYLPA